MFDILPMNEAGAALPEGAAVGYAEDVRGRREDLRRQPVVTEGGWGGPHRILRLGGGCLISTVQKE